MFLTLYPSNCPLLPAPSLSNSPLLLTLPPSSLFLSNSPLLLPLPHLLTSSVLSRVPSLLLLSVVVTSEESSPSTLDARIKLGRSLPFLQNPKINIVSSSVPYLNNFLMINPNMSHTQIFIEMFVKKLAWHKKLSKKRNEWSNSKKDEQVFIQSTPITIFLIII